tara:strand:+ start:1038 stop:1736 length:699 start_codon:yes stop_codon:yes gene_type:complete
MPKRYVEPCIWEEDWFFNLSAGYKLAVKYLYEKCDPIGRWSPNFQIANFIIGGEVDWMKVKDEILKDEIEVLPDGRWWLKGFCRFQYSVLNHKQPVHKRYIQMLEDAKLLDRVEHSLSNSLINSLPNRLEEEEEEKKKNKIKIKKKNKRIIFKVPLVKEIEEYMKELEFPDYETMSHKFFDHYERIGWMVGKNKMKDWKASVRYWKRNQNSDVNVAVDSNSLKDEWKEKYDD